LTPSREGTSRQSAKGPAEQESRRGLKRELVAGVRRRALGVSLPWIVPTGAALNHHSREAVALRDLQVRLSAHVETSHPICTNEAGAEVENEAARLRLRDGLERGDRTYAPAPAKLRRDAPAKH
jgi:hypothetical protein